jgi:hypothetical protein
MHHSLVRVHIHSLYLDCGPLVADGVQVVHPAEHEGNLEDGLYKYMNCYMFMQTHTHANSLSQTHTQTYTHTHTHPRIHARALPPPAPTAPRVPCTWPSAACSLGTCGPRAHRPRLVCGVYMYMPGHINIYLGNGIVTHTCICISSSTSLHTRAHPSL